MGRKILLRPLQTAPASFSYTALSVVGREICCSLRHINFYLFKRAVFLGANFFLRVKKLPPGDHATAFVLEAGIGPPTAVSNYVIAFRGQSGHFRTLVYCPRLLSHHKEDFHPAD